MSDIVSDIVKVLVFSFIAYAFLFIIAKLLGKKQIAQLSFIDYVVGISIGSIAAEMSTETDKPFYHYLIAMSVFFLFDLAISLLGRKGAFMKNVVTGKPLIIINDGIIDYSVLKKSKLTIDEIAGLARDKNFFELSDIAYAILETQGTLSILPKAAKQSLVAENFDIKLPRPTIPQYVITDGNICYDVLGALGKDKNWLLQKLEKQSENGLKNILMAEYDEQNDKIKVTVKQSAKND